MTKPNTTQIVLILDRSGSMASVADDTIGGVNTFLEEQRKVKTDDARVTLVQFDNDYEVVFANTPIATAPALTRQTFVPRGSTALLDAIGRTINKVGQDLKALTEDQRPDLVMVAIVTDGYENCSVEYTRPQIMEMIRHQESVYRWKFLFLGANQDAIQAGGGLGISASNAMSYASTGRGVDSVYKSISHNVASSRKSRNVADLNFTSAQRDDAMAEGDDEASSTTTSTSTSTS